MSARPIIDSMEDVEVLSLIGYIAGMFGLIAVIASAVVITRSTTTKTTIESQKELIDTLLLGKEEQKDQINDLMQKHIESSKAISGLQGQVDVLKDIPLREISGDMKKIATEMISISKNQKEVVELLKKNGVAA